jgi:hypothetical protein
MAELTIEPYGIPRPYATAMVTATSALQAAGPIPPPTPVETGELVVQAVIRARWQFVGR